MLKEENYAQTYKGCRVCKLNAFGAERKSEKAWSVFH